MNYYNLKLLGASLVATILAASVILAQTGRPARGSAVGEPALEKYTCHQSFPSGRGSMPWLHQYVYMGYVRLLPGGKYEYGRGGRQMGGGRYTFDAKAMDFTGGPLQGVKGTYQIKKGGRHYIEMLILNNGGKKIKQYCNCDAHDTGAQ